MCVYCRMQFLACLDTELANIKDKNDGGPLFRRDTASDVNNIP